MEQFAHSELVLDQGKIREADGKGVVLRSIRDGKVLEEFVSNDVVDKIVKDNAYFSLVIVCILFEVQKPSTEQERSWRISKAH